MENYSSNCYGFMHAGLLNSEDDFYLSRDEAFEWVNWIKQLDKKLNKIQWNTSDTIADCLLEDGENKYSVIEIFDWDKKSQHVAFIDNAWNFYDQDGPDWEFRGIWEKKWKLEELLLEYKEKLWWTAYYQIHILDKDLSTKVENFLDGL